MSPYPESRPGRLMNSTITPGESVTVTVAAPETWIVRTIALGVQNSSGSEALVFATLALNEQIILAVGGNIDANVNIDAGLVQGLYLVLFTGDSLVFGATDFGFSPTEAYCQVHGDIYGQA